MKRKCVLDDGENEPSDNYTKLLQVWKRQNMTTFKDFLVWYNNLDVGPFVTALKKNCECYRHIRIDILKTTISAPGISRQLLFDAASKCGGYFALFDQQNKDLYETLKSNITGGPSIISTRYHEAGKTYIRSNSEYPCKSIVGYDANALYLWALDQPLPVGSFFRRSSV